MSPTSEVHHPKAEAPAHQAFALPCVWNHTNLDILTPNTLSIFLFALLFSVFLYTDASFIKQNRKDWLVRDTK